MFEMHAPKLWTIAAAVLGDRRHVEDVLQEACVVGLERLSSFSPGTRFDAWMGQIVRYVSLNHSRKRAHVTHPDVDLVESRADVASDPEPVEGPLVEDVGLAARGELPEDQDQLDDAVVSALRSVSPTARACLLLRTLHHLTYREIGELLGVPEGTAMSHVHRSRAQMRRLLSPASGEVA